MPDDKRFDLARVDVARHRNHRILGTIPAIVESLERLGRRAFQCRVGANGSMASQRLPGEEERTADVGGL